MIIEARASFQFCINITRNNPIKVSVSLNKVNRARILPYNDSIFGMVKKVKHLAKYEIME